MRSPCLDELFDETLLGSADLSPTRRHAEADFKKQFFAEMAIRGNVQGRCYDSGGVPATRQAGSFALQGLGGMATGRFLGIRPPSGEAPPRHGALSR